MVMKTFDLKACLEELSENFKQEAKIKGMDLQLDYMKGDSFLSTDDIRTDESKLRLVLYNLLSNSVRFSQNGLIRLKSRFLTITQAKDRIDSYLKKLQSNNSETEQSDLLLNYRRELETNYDSKDPSTPNVITLYQSSDTQDFNRSHDMISYERKIIHITIEDNGQGI